MCHPSPPGCATLYANCLQISPYHTPSFVISPQYKEVECHHEALSVSREHAVWSVSAHNRSPARGILFLSVRFLSTTSGSLPLWAISQGPGSGGGVFIKCAQGWQYPLLMSLALWIQPLLHALLFLECTSAAGHMSDQRHSREALSHWCLPTAGWMIESRANRWAPGRAGIKGALSEKRDGETQKGLRKNRESKESKSSKAERESIPSFLFVFTLKYIQNDKHSHLLKWYSKQLYKWQMTRMGGWGGEAYVSLGRVGCLLIRRAVVWSPSSPTCGARFLTPSCPNVSIAMWVLKVLRHRKKHLCKWVNVLHLLRLLKQSRKKLYNYVSTLLRKFPG